MSHDGQPFTPGQYTSVVPDAVSDTTGQQPVNPTSVSPTVSLAAVADMQAISEAIPGSRLFFYDSTLARRSSMPIGW